MRTLRVLGNVGNNKSHEEGWAMKKDELLGKIGITAVLVSGLLLMACMLLALTPGNAFRTVNPWLFGSAIAILFCCGVVKAWIS